MARRLSPAATTRLWRGSMDAIPGLAILVVANVLLDPVPLTALLAWALGLALCWIAASRPIIAAVIGSIAGAALGAVLHFFVHDSGRSPAPVEGLPEHLLLDAGTGLLCGIAALAAGIGRHLWRKS